MTRREFPIGVRRAALLRSGKLCEAVGEDYGLPADQRCNGDLSAGVHFDHINPDGLTGEPTLENCAAVCPKCHKIKTATVDVPRIARAKRRADRKDGIRKPSTFRKPPPGTRFEAGPFGLRAVKDDAR